MPAVPSDGWAGGRSVGVQSRVYFCLRNRIILQQHVQKNQIRQTEFLRLVAATKFCCRNIEFHINSPVNEAMCGRNVLMQLVARLVHTQ